MFDDDNDQYGFWSDEPTRALDRLAARRKPAGPAPIAPTRRPRPVDPQVGRRQHGDTQQVPVISTEPAASTRGSARPVRPHIDPLLRRMGAMAVAVALCVPVAMSLRGGDTSSSLQAGSAAQSSQSAQSAGSTDGAAATVGAAAAETAATQSSPAASAAPETNAPTAALPAATDAAETSAVAETASAPASVARVVSAVPAASPVIEAVAETVATSVAPQCEKEYDVVAGDYWILIAKKVSVSLKEVLAANGATTDSPIYPGRTVCLPATASTPTTAAPATTAAPTTVKATTTTAAATTTAKATTTTVAVAVKTTSTSTPAAAAPAASYSRTAVEAIIRQVWPDNLEDEAVRIATRESNLIPTVRNYCCFGLFQVYFNVHKTWLAQSGVTSPEQLYDPLTNAYIAYAMYLKAGGWGPWGM